MTSRSLGHRAPLLWIVVPMIAGLAAARVKEFAPIGWLMAGAVVAAAAAVAASWRAPRWFAPLLCSALFFAGAASYGLHRPRIGAWDQLPPREARVSLRVERVFHLPEPNRTAGLARITAADEPLQELVGQRVYFSLTLRRDEAKPIRSSVISAIGVIETLPRDPPANSFDGYLANAGVNFRFSRGRTLAEVAPPIGYYRFCARQAERFAGMLGRGIDAKRPELAAVLRAMMLGWQHELSEEQDALFRQSGTMHVFSISGLHIAVIAAGLHALLLLLRLPRALRFACGLAALWLYVDITGAAPSAVRAFVMVALFEASLVLRLPRNPVAALAGSALLVVLFAPLQIFSASFQLSYAIVGALLLLGLPLADRWQQRLVLFKDLPKVTWRWPHRAADAIWRTTLAALALGVAASLVSAVAGVMFFELLTPGALVANLWLIPASSFVILAGFVSMLCGLANFGAGSELANHAAALLLWAIEGGVRLFAALPGAWVGAQFRDAWIGPVALAGLLAALAYGYGRRWAGWQRGFWAPFAWVALVLLVGVKLG